VPLFSIDDRPTAPGFSAELLRLAASLGVAEERLLAAADPKPIQAVHNPGPPAVAPSPPRAREVRNLSIAALELTGEPALGLMLGPRLQVSQLGFLGYAMMSSATLRDALELADRYDQLLSPFCSAQLCEPRDEWGVRAQALVLRSRLGAGDRARGASAPAGSDAACMRFGKEATASCLLEQARFVRGEPIELLAARFDYPRPPHAARYAAIFGVEPEFGAPVCELVFDATQLEGNLRFACAPAARMAAEQCERLLAHSEGTGDLAARVASALRARLDNPPDADQTARLMGMSKRSLARSLQQQGTTFQTILDGVREERAKALITGSGLPFEAIAQELGFSSGRAFRRAFRKWTGSAPSELRAPI